MAGIIFSEGAGVADSVFGLSQAPIRMFLEKRAEAYEQESMLDKMFCMGSTNHGIDRYTSMTGMEDFQPVGENGAYPETGMREGHSRDITQMTWKNKFSITQEAVEDSQLIDFKKKPQAFIGSYHRKREKFGAAIYGEALNGKSSFKLNGFDFNIACADGKPLLHASHPPAGRGKAQSNVASDAFSADALAAAEEKMQNYRDDDGELLGIIPDTIVIPNDFKLKKDVFAVIGADKDPATSNNGFNFEFGRWNVIVWPYLNPHIASGARPWMLMSSQYLKDYEAAPWLDRVPLSVRSILDNNTDANSWLGRARFSAGFVDWRHVFGGGITGATAMISTAA